MILAITSIADPEARKAEKPRSRLRTGSPELEYLNDLIVSAIPYEESFAAHTG
jgi:hypothetical protein